MNHIKLIEAQVTKKFTDWLKNPKKPEDETKIYIFSFSGKIETTLRDEGVSIKNLLLYLEQEQSISLWREIAEAAECSIRELKDDEDLLDEAFEKYLSTNYTKHGWMEFNNEFFYYESPLNTDVLDVIYNTIGSIDTKFSNDDAWFNVTETSIIPTNKLSSYPIKLGSRSKTFGKVFFEVKTSRALRSKEEIGWLKDHVSSIMSQICDSMELREIQDVRLSSGSSIKLVDEVDIDTEPNQVYPTSNDFSDIS